MTTTDTSTSNNTATRTRHRMIFVNLPVADLDASRAFFTAVGYGFDEQMCNGQALAVELGDNLYAMLLHRDFFSQFHQGRPVEAGQHEVLICLSADSAAHVDEIVDAAVAAGGRDVRKEEAGDFMYGRSFADLDRHVWEIMWMDVEAAADAGTFG